MNATLGSSLLPERFPKCDSLRRGNIIEFLDHTGSAFYENAARVEVFKTTADRKTRAGRINKVRKPEMMRSEDRRLGARFRPLFTIRTWCLIKTDSATTERRPPAEQAG